MSTVPMSEHEQYVKNADALISARTEHRPQSQRGVSRGFTSGVYGSYPRSGKGDC
jgi:hypothetical protein